MAGSAREAFGHSMRTSDAWRHKDSMRQCSGDLQYSEELVGMLGDLVDRRFLHTAQSS